MTTIEVYGADHSPWVQAVLLGLHEKNISHTLRTAPPFGLFCKTGILMPAARFETSPWQLDSYEILHQVGYEKVSDEDLAEIYHAWSGVANRVDSGFRFLARVQFSPRPKPVASASTSKPLPTQFCDVLFLSTHQSHETNCQAA